MNKNSFSYQLTVEQQAQLKEVIRLGNYRTVSSVPHSILGAETDACRIVLYKSGKLLVQGKGAADFVMFVLEPLVLKHVKLGYEEALNPDAYNPHMGVDESGKGDFFGPIVVAAAYADSSLAKTMLNMGVKDSKNITSDKRALELAVEIRKLLKGKFSIVLVGASAYNRLYAKMRNVNTLLAWGHARAIENLLEIVPDCPRAVSDQFGSKHLIEKALLKNGRRIELVQRHRAEADVAVAAASILARAMFLKELAKMSEQLGLRLPKGASSAVVEIGRQLVREQGPTVLAKTAKCHFKTTDTILESVALKRSDIGPEGLAVSRPQVIRRKEGSS